MVPRSFSRNRYQDYPHAQVLRAETAFLQILLENNYSASVRISCFTSSNLPCEYLRGRSLGSSSLHIASIIAPESPALSVCPPGSFNDRRCAAPQNSDFVTHSQRKVCPGGHDIPPRPRRNPYHTQAIGLAKPRKGPLLASFQLPDIPPLRTIVLTPTIPREHARPIRIHLRP